MTNDERDAYYRKLELKRNREQCRACTRCLIDEHGRPYTEDHYPSQANPLRCFIEPNGPAFWLCGECARAAFESLDHISYEEIVSERAESSIWKDAELTDIPPGESPWRRGA